MTVKALSTTTAELALGDVWLIDVSVDSAEVPVVTVTPPDGVAEVPAVTDLGDRYRTAYVVAATGRYIARAVTTANGVAEFAAYVTGTTAGTAMPDLAAVLNYLGWDTDNERDDAAGALATELAAQRRVCRIGAAYDDDLRGALYRRVARNLALKGIPLAVLRGDAEGGSTVLPGRDPEVRRLEGPHRKLVVG